VRQRMQIVQRCWYSGQTLRQTLDNVNAWGETIGQHWTSVTTISTDRHNLQVLAAEAQSPEARLLRLSSDELHDLMDAEWGAL
jgi:hypothetical protein